MRTIRIAVLILLGILWPRLLMAQEDITVRVAVLPLEIFSMEETPSLGRELSIQLSQQLSLNPRILTCSQDLIAPLLSGRKGVVPDQAQLAKMAQSLDAHFIVSGSLTKIQNDMSMDVQLYNNFDTEALAKTYAEGTGIEALVREIAQKLEQEIFKKAALIPQSQRIKTAGAAAAVKSEEPIPDMIEEPKEAAPAVKPAEEKPRAAEAAPAPPEKKPEVAEEEAAGEEPAAPEPEKKTELKPSEQKPKKTAKHQDTDKDKKSGPSFGNNSLPVNIHADTLEYDNKQNQVAFNGHVVARQGDMVIFADAMKVDYESKGKLRQIQAQGGVKIIQGDRIATGDTITFYNEQQKIVLSGNPRVWQGDNVITGEKITVYIKEERSVVEGSQAGRVSATIVPKKK
jgi:lipopolysaccharide export system protein LptA